MTVLPGALPVVLFPLQLSAYFAIDIFMTAASLAATEQATGTRVGFYESDKRIKNAAVTNGSSIPGDSNW